ncbi:YtzI protein [Pontibacillus chungwhensis]|uniref:YtzI protein n=1 Tax=Pontibacillus chungwhensis TaxID=265426 RepID=UPI000B22393A|nr:YtzI protein [Pontibacillus chungwhensis]
MVGVIVICLIIMIAVLALTMATISAGYNHKETVDPLPDNPYEDHSNHDTNHKTAE